VTPLTLGVPPAIIKEWGRGPLTINMESPMIRKTKAFYASKTLQGIALAYVSAAYPIAPLALGGDPMAIVALATQTIGAIWAVIGRFKAETELG
jgi:hypothetical protein